MAVPLTLSRLLAAALALTVLVGCSLLESQLAPGPSPTHDDTAAHFPDVLAVELRPLGERRYDVTVTLSSPYDTPQRYAEGWRVLDPAGNVLGIHTLLHDHAAEQPFTRTQRDVLIPAGIDRVTIEGRDLVHGFGGRRISVEVPL